MLNRFLPVFLLAMVASAAEVPKMKTIEYRGGVVTFSVPAQWKEEYQPEGGGMFYDERPDSGTLRLNVLTFKAPNGKLAVDGYRHITAKPPARGERLSKTERGDGIKFSKKAAEEDGEKLLLYSWELVHCAPPEKLYVAIFTWTILASQDRDPKIQEEISLIGREISKAYFHADLGKL